jgi:hypothetical protein
LRPPESSLTPESGRTACGWPAARDDLRLSGIGASRAAGVDALCRRNSRLAGQPTILDGSNVRAALV